MKHLISLLLCVFTFQTKAQTSKNPDSLFNPTPYGFSHASSVKTPGELVYISGQSGGLGKEHILSPDFKEQVQTALKNLTTILNSYQLKPENVMKITVLIVDHSSEKLKIWEEEIRKTWKNKPFPASTLIPVPRLALDNMQIEVDAVAFKSIK
ncbi:RidA family protein [Flavobacterium johnsoniae]|uniref:Enamine deaminase RidA, house cleaning of reactive enamine intermediates, YjgF/YER057c/UK114 family n=1 Tax=Flavobacterium johnsoniae TaxID=986 RepID=A0A1M5PX26_FLAJO|nr:RidA family protein [Flavobacterium johnsoniae]SHH06220.1 Enamine deaminase RidA, house cleaning of reactive enamine intermediates, YjgF/YER057c/UK114 family [Flavobacterium johnsoniae]